MGGALLSASCFSLNPVRLRTVYGTTHLEGTHASHPLHSNTEGNREHIEAPEVADPRMRKLQDGPFWAEHVEM